MEMAAFDHISEQPTVEWIRLVRDEKNQVRNKGITQENSYFLIDW